MSNPAEGVVPRETDVSAQLSPPLITYDLTKAILTLPDGITVRALSHSDAPSIAKYANNIKIARNMTNTWPIPYNLDEAHDWVTRARDETKWTATGPTDPKSNNTKGLGQKIPFAWAICLDDEMVGGIGGHHGDDIHARSMSMGYWLGEPFWGRGIMSAVASAFIEWALETYPWIVKIWAGAYGWNPASTRIMQKCGMEWEGLQRCAIQRLGVVGDLVLYGRVRDGVQGSKQPPAGETASGEQKAG